ncbi:MAG: T9SS type A sorting domain-containing protein [Crocinitomicaceae bacterium]|nr:T9SS type A sorting domain-containing protein [Crocinitomicaceae bacterium]
MKIKLQILVIAIFYTLHTYGQNSTWILPPNSYDIVNGNVTPLPTGPSDSSFDNYTGFPSQYGANGIANLDGSLKFFVVDGLIYDYDGSYIEYAWRPFNPDSYYEQINDTVYKLYPKGNGSDLIIVPHPQDCEKFYLIASYENTGDRMNSVPFYALFDYSTKQVIKRGRWYTNPDVNQQWETPVFNGYGSYANGDLPMAGATYTDYYYGRGQTTYAVTEKKSDGSRYIISSMGLGVIILKLDNNGDLNYWKRSILPAISDFSRFYRGETEIYYDPVSNKTTIATAKTSYISGIGYTHALQLFDIDLETATFYTPPKIIPLVMDNNNVYSLISGIEFSPNGQYLYFSCNSNAVNPSQIYYYDRVNDVVTSLGVSNSIPIQKGNIEKDVNGNLMFASANGLYKLSNANTPQSINFSSSPIVTIPIYGNHLTDDPSNYNQNLLAYNLPNQIDNQDYNSIFNGNLYCCIDNKNYDMYNYSASSGTWNGSSPIAPGSSSITIKEELRIPAGVSLTINNMTLEFAPGARLVIENGTSGSQGGKLILNGTTLTVDDRCDTNTMWLGVEVWGNTTAAQGSVLNSSQGVFRMYNNSKIEHAEIGVLISRRNETNGVPISTSYNGNFNGGVFIAENSSFYNCWIGTMFQSYGVAATNLSRISSCNYTWNGQLRDLTKTPHVHLGIVQCNKIYVTATKFNQNTPSIYTNKNKWGIGILALNSDFAVSSSCSTILPIGQDCSEANTIRSEFNNLTTGVGVLNGNNKPFTVLRNEFTNCLYGVTSATAKNQKISRNNFFIHEDNAIQTWGISVKNGTGYEIAENKLQSMTGAIDQTYGIIIDNSGEDKNEVYKNFFVDLYVGTQAQNVNGKVYVPGTNNISQGLRYNCNTFKSFIEKADIAVAVNSRIDYEQGRVGGSSINEARNSNTARNEFSYTPLATDIFLSTGSQQVNYYHLANPGHAPLTYTNTPPIAVYPALQTWGSAPLYADNFTCLTKYPSTWPPIVFSFPFGNSIKIDSLYNLVDGGKSSYLLGLIETQPTSSFTFNELMDASPYLSDTVLTNYIYSKASNNYLKDVLIQNSKLTGVVWDTLKASSRPSGLKDNIAWYQGGVSAMQELYEAIKINEDRLMDAQQVYIYSILDDTTLVSKNDTLVKYLELCRGETYKKQLLNVYSSMQNQTKFDSLLTVITLPKYMKEYYKIVYQLDKKGDWITAIEQDSTILNDLIALSQKDNVEIASNAATILDIYYGNYSNFELLPLVNTPKSLVIHNGNSSEENVEKQSGFMVFPNPSHGTVTVQFSEMDVQTAIVQLVDLSGKELFTQKFTNSKNAELDLSSIKKGTYLLKIEVDGHLTSSQLLILE